MAFKDFLIYKLFGCMPHIVTTSKEYLTWWGYCESSGSKILYNFHRSCFSSGHSLHQPLYENELSTSLPFVVLYLMCCILKFLLYLCLKQNVCRLNCWIFECALFCLLFILYCCYSCIVTLSLLWNRSLIFCLENDNFRVVCVATCYN